MSERLTMPIDPSQPNVGYIINTGLSDELYRSVHDLQTRLGERFPGAIWIPPRDSLHITLMDWSAPSDYQGNRDELFGSVETRYLAALTQALEGQQAIPADFGTIEVYPGAIIVKGQDDGSYQRIRGQFLAATELLPGTKPPPSIVHTTICKFLKEVDLGEVREFMQTESIQAHETINEFRLTRETQIFLSEYETLRRFRLLNSAS